MVCAVAFSPDGKTLASAGYDHTVRLWGVFTGQEIRQFAGHQDAVCAIAFSPDGKTLASASLDNVGFGYGKSPMARNSASTRDTKGW